MGKVTQQLGLYREGHNIKMSRGRVLDLISSIGAASCSCPAHSQAFSKPSWFKARPPAPSPHTGPKDYAFEMACSNIRYGPGVTQEVGMDMAGLGAKNVGVYTDSTETLTGNCGSTTYQTHAGASGCLLGI